MGPAGMHPWVPREMADIERPLSLWKIMRGVWKKADVALVYKKEDNYRLISLTLILGKVTEQLILETISRHPKEKKIIRIS